MIITTVLLLGACNLKANYGKKKKVLKSTNNRYIDQCHIRLTGTSLSLGFRVRINGLS